jgi:DNA-binding response OmpR family regulator
MAKILVIDDDKDILEIVTYLAAQDGHDVVKAANGREGFDRALAELPNLIILDIMMPEMDGYTVNMKLLAHVSTQSIPVIILTAKGGKMREAFLPAPNVRAYMEKPFEPEDLLGQMRAVLAEKSRLS